MGYDDENNVTNNQYYYWLVDEEYSKQCKDKLKAVYEEFYKTENKEKRAELLKQLEVYLFVVCDAMAYRYLVKHYMNLFHKLCITVEEYLDYKVRRLLVTIRDKKDHIDDILGYIYMSFMLSSPRLIYDYGKEIGHCSIQKENLPYYLVARLRFFNDSLGDSIEQHVISNVDSLYIDDNGSNDKEQVRSNIDKYSYAKWKQEKQIEDEGYVDIQKIKTIITKSQVRDKSKNYILQLFDNWHTVESNYQEIKLSFNSNPNFSFIDYIKYNYNNGLTDLDYEEYVDVLKLFNIILKSKA